MDGADGELDADGPELDDPEFDDPELDEVESEATASLIVMIVGAT